MTGLPTIMMSPSCEWPIEPPEPGKLEKPSRRPRKRRVRLAAVAAVALVSFGVGVFADAFATPCRSVTGLPQSMLARLSNRSAAPDNRSIAMAEPVHAGTAPDDSSGGRAESRPIKALGATVATLTPRMRQEIGLPDSVDGVAITELAFDGAGAQARLLVNDVIERIGDHPVRTPADLEAVIKSMVRAKQPSLPLTINRGGVESAAVVKITGE